MSARGRAIVANRSVGLCLLCHSAPIPEERFQGNLAPSLAGAGSRATPDQLRLRLADPARLNPDTIMPPYYRMDGLTRVAKNFQGKTILTAEQIEDVVAYLASLEGVESRHAIDLSTRPSLPVLPWSRVAAVASAHATPEAMAAAIKEVTGGAPLREGKVTLDIPPLVENGNAVPLTVKVDSPMTADDHVKAIHVFNEKNPQPHVFNAWLSPANGQARGRHPHQARRHARRSSPSPRPARASSGRRHADVIVTIAACIEDIT